MPDGIITNNISIQNPIAIYVLVSVIKSRNKHYVVFAFQFVQVTWFEINR